MIRAKPSNVMVRTERAFNSGAAPHVASTLLGWMQVELESVCTSANIGMIYDLKVYFESSDMVE